MVVLQAEIGVLLFARDELDAGHIRTYVRGLP
jgi:hypothetical protein